MTQAPVGIQAPDVLPKRQHNEALTTAIRRVETFPPDESPQFLGELVYYEDTVQQLAFLYVANRGATGWIRVASTSEVPTVVYDPLVETAKPTFSGNLVVGQQLTWTQGNATGGKAPLSVESYWQANPTGEPEDWNVTGDGTSPLVLSNLHLNTYIRVVSVVTDSQEPSLTLIIYGEPSTEVVREV